MYKKTKQIGAIIAILLLVGLYVATLVFALIDSPFAEKMFQTCLFATIAVPILLWLFIWVFKKTDKQKDELEQTISEGASKEDTEENHLNS